MNGLGKLAQSKAMHEDMGPYIAIPFNFSVYWPFLFIFYLCCAIQISAKTMFNYFI